MKSVLSNALTSYGLANKPIPLWVVASPRGRYMGPITQDEHRLRGAAIVQSRLRVTATLTYVANRRSSSTQRDQLLQRPSRQSNTCDVHTEPPTLPVTPNQLMLHAQHVNVDEDGTVEWLSHLATYQDEGVRDTAIEVFTTRAIQQLVKHSLAGLSERVLHLLAQSAECSTLTKADEAFEWISYGEDPLP